MAGDKQAAIQYVWKSLLHRQELAQEQTTSLPGKLTENIVGIKLAQLPAVALEGQECAHSNGDAAFNGERSTDFSNFGILMYAHMKAGGKKKNKANNSDFTEFCLCSFQAFRTNNPERETLLFMN